MAERIKTGVDKQIDDARALREQNEAFLKKCKEDKVEKVNLLNKYADEGYVLAFNEGLDATGGKNIEKSYKSKNLNTNVVIYNRAIFTLYNIYK